MQWCVLTWFFILEPGLNPKPGFLSIPSLCVCPTTTPWRPRQKAAKVGFFKFLNKGWIRIFYFLLNPVMPHRNSDASLVAAMAWHQFQCVVCSLESKFSDSSLSDVWIFIKEKPLSFSKNPYFWVLWASILKYWF